MIGIHPRVLLLGIIFSAGLTACGQSGALYLPGSEAANSASSTPKGREGKIASQFLASFKGYKVYA